jgi:hypothetical protein
VSVQWDSSDFLEPDKYEELIVNLSCSSPTATISTSAPYPTPPASGSPPPATPWPRFSIASTPFEARVSEQSCTDRNLELGYGVAMNHPISMLAVQLDSDDGLVVTFSDGTTTGYVVEELLDLRPHREPIELYPITDRCTKTDPVMT